jgi:dissimilatory sulfite reductase (desulfoviridin) alpha/beta subunit
MCYYLIHQREGINMTEFDKAFTDAMHDAVLYGHGFIRITNNNGLEAHHIKLSEFDDIAELFNWIKKNKVTVEQC